MEIKKAPLKFVKSLTKRKKTTEIIIHCSATKEGKNFTVNQIHNMHLQRGFSGIGYNYYIDLNGDIWEGRAEECVGAHTTNHNSISVGICYCGGLDSNGKPKDTRTPLQLAAMIWLCRMLHKKYPNATFHGHKEFANKACPCFDVKQWVKTFSLDMPDNGMPAPNFNASIQNIANSEIAQKISNAFSNMFDRINRA
jgi:N-acetylmuramoyl-L-alanine amidase